MPCQWSRFVRLAVACLAIAACSDGGTAPAPAPGIRIVSGGEPVDTVEGLSHELVLSVRGADGTPAARVPVTLTPPRDSLRPSERTVAVCGRGEPCAGLPGQMHSGVTDAAGTLRVTLFPGTVAGRHRIEIAAPSTGFTNAVEFLLNAGAPTRLVVLLAGRQAVELGSTVRLGAVVDRLLNPRHERVDVTTFGDGSVLAYDSTSGTARGAGLGNQPVTVRAGTLSITANVAVVPKGRLVVSTPNAELWALNTDGTLLRRIASVTGPDNDVTPVLSATASTILYSSNMDEVKYTEFVLASIDTNGGSRRVLRKEFGFNQPLAARAMPDGSLLVLGSSENPYFGDWPILRIAPDNAITRLGTIADGGGSNSVMADISPDGARIAYCSGAVGRLPTINVYEIATGATRVATTACSSPRWSPDGQRIAFLDDSAQPGFAGRLAVVNADGTGRRFVGAERVGPGLSWSPDGQYMVSHNAVTGTVYFTRVSDGKTAEAYYAKPDFTPATYSRPYWR